MSRRPVGLLAQSSASVDRERLNLGTCVEPAIFGNRVRGHLRRLQSVAQRQERPVGSGSIAVACYRQLLARSRAVPEGLASLTHTARQERTPATTTEIERNA
jgi:hypothetical protein